MSPSCLKKEKLNKTNNNSPSTQKNFRNCELQYMDDETYKRNVSEDKIKKKHKRVVINIRKNRLYDTFDNCCNFSRPISSHFVYF